MPDSTVEISTDPSRMDVAMIQEFLSNTYWANGRTVAQVESCIEHSTPFGVFVDGRQVAFARVLTDRTVFAYLMDMFVLPEYRGRGFARRLIDNVLNHPEFENVATWSLKTRDAHGLYKQFGFTAVSDTDRLMCLSRK